MERLVSRTGEHGPRPDPLPANAALFADLQMTETIQVSCSPTEAWALITDVTRIGEFSPECIEAKWLDGATSATPGARFEGTNRVVDGDTELIWIRPCTIVDAEFDRRFVYTVGDRYDGTPASAWEFVIEATGPNQCRITQTFRHEPDGLSGLRGFADAQPDQAEQIVANRRSELQAGMRETLLRMKAVLESG